ncbi:MAG TPA: peptide chain release factor N(5)-glutamine methyltransferase [Firmicutes bacterium]|nr:peptide chain release factor N(5)-glutamine methyltransferase [Bacillota bacterium]
MTKQHTIGELISLSAGYLEDKGCSSARLDAELLLGHVLHLDRLDLYLNFDKPLSVQEVNEYRRFIGQRGQRIPLAYLTGEREFYALPIHVNRNVLIPRPETEFVVDKVLELLEPQGSMEILDLGTGSGAVALALACQDPGFRITAVDISPEALQVAQDNARRLEVDQQVRFVESDLFAQVEGKYAVICSNPPYIRSNELAKLAPELGVEPALALDGGPDGLDFYRRILGQAASFLEQPGFVVLEIGWDQGIDVRSIGEQAGFRWRETSKDYSGQDRVVVFQWM